jgi:glycolate oxidase FAD binding subunit
VLYDWGGGLIWLAMPPRPDAQAELVRRHAATAGGHAMLLRAADEVRKQLDVFPPASAGVAALNERVRQSFDPKGILNRGRMARG